jgi:hypothetical protein
MSAWTSSEAENWKFVFRRLDNLESELSELREATWPVCQGLKDQRSQMENIQEKRRFFKFLNQDAIRRLLRLKGEFMGKYPALNVEELRQVLVEEPRVAAGEAQSFRPNVISFS